MDVQTIYDAMGHRGVEFFARSCYYTSVAPVSHSSGVGGGGGSRPATFTGNVPLDDGADFCVSQGGSRVGNSAFRLPAVLKSVCAEFFQTAFGICHNTMVGWMAPGRGRCATPPVHRGVLHPANNGKCYDAMIEFVVKFAEEYGQPWPVYHHGDGSRVLIYLPPCYSIRDLWRMYNASVVREADVLSWRSFELAFNARAELDHIQTQSNDHNCCSRCASLALSLRHARQDTERFEATLKEFDAHLELVSAMTEQKRSVVERCEVLGSGEWAVLEIDYKSALKIPHTALELADEFQPFSLHGMQVQVFGVFDHGRRHTHIVLHAEGAYENSNFTIAGLQNYFEQRRQEDQVSPRNVVLYMDSCSGQNRNSNLLCYLASRLHFRFHDTISVRYFPVGHTHCSVDAMFALLDARYKNCDIFTMQELVNAVETATRSESATKFTASVASADTVADFWRSKEFLEDTSNLRLRKDPIREIQLFRKENGVHAMMIMQNGETRMFGLLIASGSAIPPYASLPFAARGAMSEQRRRTLREDIVSNLPKDEHFDKRKKFWLEITSEMPLQSPSQQDVQSIVPVPEAVAALLMPMAAKVVVAVDSGTSSSFAAPNSGRPSAARSCVTDAVARVAVVRAAKKRVKMEWFSDTRIDELACATTADWSEFESQLTKSRRKFAMRFKDFPSDDEFKGWTIGTMEHVHPIEKHFNSKIGGVEKEISLHKFDAQFDDGRMNEIKFEEEYSDIRALKPIHVETDDNDSVSTTDAGKNPRKRGRPPRTITTNKQSSSW